MEEKLKLPEQCTFVFSGDHASIQEIFEALNKEVLSYKKTSNGKERKSYKLRVMTDNSILVGISFASIELRKLGMGCVSLSYNCGLDRYGWNIRNTLLTLDSITKAIQNLATKYEYSLVDNCTGGLPYSVVYTKNYSGIEGT